MKREMELIRELLLFTEAHGNDNNGFIDEIAIEGYTDAQISQHVWMLGNGGFIATIDLSCSAETCFRPRCLTWQGYEFLEAIRERDTWQKTKQIAAAAGSGSVAAIYQIAKKLIEKKLEQLLLNP